MGTYCISTHQRERARRELCQEPSSPSSHTAQGAFIVARVIAYSWLCRTRGVISTESPEPGYIVVFHCVCPHSRFRNHRHQPRSCPPLYPSPWHLPSPIDDTGC